MGEKWWTAIGGGFEPASADRGGEIPPSVAPELVRALLELLLPPHDVGIEIADVGHLDARRGHHAAGAPYAIIRTACAAAAAAARDALAPIAGLSAEDWCYGWVRVPGEQALSICIYPDVRRARALTK
jgi:hypothetical protein